MATLTRPKPEPRQPLLEPGKQSACWRPRCQQAEPYPQGVGQQIEQAGVTRRHQPLKSFQSGTKEDEPKQNQASLARIKRREAKAQYHVGQQVLKLIATLKARRH
ncbi:hypothetical protein Thi970DRAFT_02268 [Thiorhodovibrio frisius]|uniref:Uncharacterized protein n=1 Tax=Thiorhodovibrio frisius TaxID=631362 RepID=H8YZA0_9GAMM|nr:hypothetical protein Thi970DRAFT_02268 [Thiorhodovibrio frisius]WPL24318.1 hypothetical protein Thiofri_04535 [Thiorhodovibrio frisius]